jgi:hypothetical protein
LHRFRWLCCVRYDHLERRHSRHEIRPRRSPGTARGCTVRLAGFRFPPDVILVAVRWYLRFGLSYRDVEELAERR